MLANQQKLFVGLTLAKGKRERYAPIWKKFYSVYQFDFTLYHQICDDVVNKPPFNSLAIYLTPTLFTFYLIYFTVISTLTKFEEQRIRKLCFVLDENNKKKHKGDEKHIYRIRSLQRIYTHLYEQAHISPFATETVVNRLKASAQQDLTLGEAAIMCRIEDLDKKGYNVHFDSEFGNQLEIKGTEMLSIKERIRAHISLLRRLKRGERL